MQQQNEPEPGEVQQETQATPIADTAHLVQRPDECDICLLVYDEQDRRPRNLPCGHTYCSLCVNVLLEDGYLICPSCRTHHCAPEVNHFPISYTVEAMMKVMKTLQVESAFQASGKAPQATEEVPQATPKGSQATEAKTKRRATAGLSRKLRSMIQEQKVSIESLDATLQKELEQLNQYRAKLVVSQTKHAHLKEELNKVVQQHQANMDLLQEENDRVEGFAEEGEEVQRELRAAQGQLDKVNTAQEAFTTINATDHTVVEVEEWLHHSREEIPNATVLSTSFMVLEATEAALDVITKETKATPGQPTPGHPNCTIMEAVESIETGQVELVHLRSRKLRKKLEAGWVFATEKYAGGTCYSSKVICKENKLYLYSLKKKSPPRMAYTLQVSKALENLRYPSISVFLDLAWPGKSTQQIHIQLVADTSLTRQFVTLCLGHTGLTYCNTNFLSVERYYNKDIVWGGDITGQKAADVQALPPIHAFQCGKKVNVSPGMVVARTDLSDVARRTQFGIVINSYYCYGNNTSLYNLGSVKDEWLDVVQGAAQSGDIRQVRVVDCGVVY